ncbi:DUF4123 domain-containing protein [Massilia alkalitolerans]|uniref:DUF4123 domain-containing protein n=1 Tax=Massilia alkalitolerans TaxID=286638 RepID=UPI0009FF8B79|nr:DUF4123 domain-containing protein [Massilia alkalitolerans]
MQRAISDIELFKGASPENTKWFALADSAQDKRLPGVISTSSRNVRCLFGGLQGSPLTLHTPHLIELPPPAHLDYVWEWISRNALLVPCFSIIATRKTFDDLYKQFVECTQVVLPDLDTMFFAFWDSAVLGTLVGQVDDRTLHIPGPVLSQDQQTLLTDGIEKWWYWDRAGDRHAIAIQSQGEIAACRQFKLDQSQIDSLVEASVPDHVLYYMNLNQYHLLEDIPCSDRYDMIRKALVQARDIGLATMRDLVDFVSIKLYYRERMDHDARIANLLCKIRDGQVSFRDAISELP